MVPRPPASAAGDAETACLDCGGASAAEEDYVRVVAPASLVTIIRACDVPSEFKELAATWPLWESKTHPQKPKGSGKFPFDYNGDYDSERVLITKGRATLTPDPSMPVTTLIDIGAGDAVYFHRGFKCMWQVHEPMAKHYEYFGDDGEPMPPPPGISCDICSADCFAESYLFEDNMDICPKCFKKGKAKYAGAEHQKFGEPFVPPAKKQKRK